MFIQNPPWLFIIPDYVILQQKEIPTLAPDWLDHTLRGPKGPVQVVTFILFKILAQNIYNKTFGFDMTFIPSETY